MKVKLARLYFISLVLLLVNVSALLAQDETYNEAPMLAEMVANGELPPVSERLPANPMVVEPLDSIGQYGGTWRMGMRGGEDLTWLTRTVGYTGLVRWNPEWTEVVPDVAESWEINEDSTEYIFHLREGMRWSDGVPFTADDLVFWYEDVSMNPELYSSPLRFMISGDEVGTVEKIDDYTVRFSFAAPNGLLLQRLASPNEGMYVTATPKHYLSQFHPRYADPDELAQMVEEAGVENWAQLFFLRGGPNRSADPRWKNPDLPVVTPWMSVIPTGPEATEVELVRNPYFYAVDTEGNQLPYIDRVHYSVGSDVETLLLEAINGEIDMQDRHIATAESRGILSQNQEVGGYTFFETIPSSSNVAVIHLNMTNPDLVKREIYQNRDFRVALSVAIDRQEIIDIVYFGRGTPAQAAPRPESPLYNERLATQYTEYDPELANELLDQVLPDRDEDGFRLLPNGERLVIEVEVIPAFVPEWTSVMQLVEGYWANVGIDMEQIVEDRAVLYDRKLNNLHDAMVWGGDGGLEVIFEPRYYFPYSEESGFATGWQYWYNIPNSELAIEPPAVVQQQMALYDELKATGDPERQNELMAEILEIAADQFYSIGIALPGNGYGIVKTNMHNVPSVMPGSFVYPNPGPTNTFTYYFSEDAS